MSQKVITKWERYKLVPMGDSLSRGEAKVISKVGWLFQRGQLFKSTA